MATACSRTPRGRPVSFSLKTNSDNKMRVGMANFIRDDLAKVGIRVTLVPVDFNTLITNIRDDKQYDTMLLGLQSGVPPGSGHGPERLAIQRTDALLEHQPAEARRRPRRRKIDGSMDIDRRACADITVRKQAWKEIQNIVNEQAWIVWLPTINAKIPLRNRFGNAQAVGHSAPPDLEHRSRLRQGSARLTPRMRTYVLRRVLQMIPLLFGISAADVLCCCSWRQEISSIRWPENPAISADTIDAMRRNVRPRSALVRAVRPVSREHPAALRLRRVVLAPSAGVRRSSGRGSATR